MGPQAECPQDFGLGDRRAQGSTNVYPSVADESRELSEPPHLTLGSTPFDSLGEVPLVGNKHVSLSRGRGRDECILQGATPTGAGLINGDSGLCSIAPQGLIVLRDTPYGAPRRDRLQRQTLICGQQPLTMVRIRRSLKLVADDVRPHDTEFSGRAGRLHTLENTRRFHDLVYDHRIDRDALHTEPSVGRLALANRYSPPESVSMSFISQALMERSRETPRVSCRMSSTVANTMKTA